MKKAAATKTTTKKAAPAKKVASKPAVAKTSAKKATVKTAKQTPVVAKPAVAQKPPKATGTAKSAAAKPAPAPVKPVAVAPAQPAAEKASVTPPLKGKVASAVSMAPPRVASAASSSSSKKQKSQSSSMNKTASKTDNGVTKEDGRYALPSNITIELPKGYRPSADEEYMGPKQLAYFRNKLRDWRDQLVEESRQTMENLRDEVRDVGDEAERATRETENSLELRTRDRYRKLISKIDKALRRIEEGRYGYCEETDEEIGVDRLDARPIATLSLDAQERREHLQKQMGD